MFIIVNRICWISIKDRSNWFDVCVQLITQSSHLVEPFSTSWIVVLLLFSWLVNCKVSFLILLVNLLISSRIKKLLCFNGCIYLSFIVIFTCNKTFQIVATVINSSLTFIKEKYFLSTMKTAIACSFSICFAAIESIVCRVISGWITEFVNIIIIYFLGSLPFHSKYFILFFKINFILKYAIPSTRSFKKIFF